MKSFYRILAALVLIIAAGITAAYIMTGLSDKDGGAVLELNSMVYTVKEHRNDLRSLTESDLGTEFILFGENGIILRKVSGDLLVMIDSPEKAAVSDCICLPVVENGNFICTLVVPDPEVNQYRSMRRRLIMAGLLILGVTVLCLLIFRIYVEAAVIRPFRKMEKFAGMIAHGELDTPLTRDKNNLFGAFTSSFDIMREELKASKKRENDLKQRKQELIASLSHDLKTPITGIKLVCELLSVKLTDEYAVEKIKNIHTKAEQMNILVSDLLASELDSLGEMQVVCRDESSAALHELVSLHDPQSLVREGVIPECLIRIDRNRLSQTIGNIISNSYKYAGTPILVNYRFNSGYLEMSIKDSGGGVPEEELALITNKFFRGSAGKSSGKEGSGLGLYIASALMAKMNGELICSSDGTGLTVTLLIPLS